MLSHFDAIIRAGQISKVEANFAQEADARDRYGKPCMPMSKRVGKHVAGALLDGREWKEMPKTMEMA